MDRIMFLGNIFPTKTRKNPNQGRVYNPSGISPTLNCTAGGNLQPFVSLSAVNKVEDMTRHDLEQVRKLTPREYFRLMGFDDNDVDVLIEHGMSNTQLYKMAGNSIAVTMLEHLFGQLYPSTSKVDSLKEQSLAILQNL